MYVYAHINVMFLPFKSLTATIVSGSPLTISDPIPFKTLLVLQLKLCICSNKLFTFQILQFLAAPKVSLYFCSLLVASVDLTDKFPIVFKICLNTL